MHIAYLTPEYPHELCPASGGLGTSIKNMTEALVAKGLQISIILYGQEIDKDFEENGTKFYFIKQKNFQAGGWYFYRKYLERRINKIIKNDKVDLLEAPDWTGITAFMNLDCSLIIRLHGTDAYFCAMEGRKQKWKNQFLERQALKNVDDIIAVSDFAGQKTMEVLDLKKSYEVIPNSIFLEDFKSLKRNPEPNRIFYFGTLIRKKGLLELPGIFNEVVKQDNDAKLILAGRDVKDIFEGVSTLELFKLRLSKKASRQFEYIGLLDYSRVRNEIEKASVVVLPSFAEALPMTWLEAMAMEKALVTSDIGWASEVMVNGETGFTVDPRNHPLYARKILELLEDKKLAEIMGKEARKRVIEKFSTEVVVQNNIRFYDEVVRKRKIDNG